jgi:aspartate kinase
VSLKVLKFGGSSVANKTLLFKVANIIINQYLSGNDIVAVVSAQGKTTNELVKKSQEINEFASAREMDVLLSTGEQASVALLCMAVEKLGFKAISLLGWQIGFGTDSEHQNARIKRLTTKRIRKELKKNNIVIVAGFQGINDWEDITTLGRGGSDTSAVAISAAMNADACVIYTDVDGVYDMDPNKFPNAKKFSKISYDFMLDLTASGTKVLNHRAVEMAKKYSVEIKVLSTFTENEGTIVSGRVHK